MHEMLHKVGVNWNDCPSYQKRGRLITRGGTYEGIWSVVPLTPIFTQDRDVLERLIPTPGY